MTTPTEPFKLVDVSEALASRVLNWKFEQAIRRIMDIPGNVRERPDVAHRLDIVMSLNAAFGDSGWFDGDMGTIVGAAVAYVLGGKPSDEDTEEEEEWEEGH